MKKFKRKKKIDRSIFLTSVVILALVILMLLLSRISKIVMPPLLAQAEMEGRRLTSLVVNGAINNITLDSADIEQLIEITKNSDGEIQLVDFNPFILNKILDTVVANVQNSLREIEQGKVDKLIASDFLKIYDQEKIKHGIIYEVPIGVAFENAFLSNLGPRIPVKLSTIGSVFSNVETSVKPHGINNALMEVAIDITVKVRVSIPFAWRDFETTNKIPLALKIINGKVPNYYSGGFNASSPLLTFPVE